jgi:hypothetical protein
MRKADKHMTSDLRVPATFHYVAFYDLLADTAFQHRLASDESDSFRMNRYARASIVAAALSVECAANCLIHSRELPAALHSELDKLPALAKIETYLLLSSSITLDRGRIEVQRMKELIAARNEYVHPKVTTIEAEVETPRDAGHAWHIPFTLDGENWPGLGIPKRSMFWSSASSQSTLRAIAAFYEYLFLDLMKSAPEDLHDILPSRVQVGDMQMVAVFEEFKREISRAKEFGADFSVFGFALDTPPPESAA